MEHWLEREIANALTTELHLAPASDVKLVRVSCIIHSLYQAFEVSEFIIGVSLSIHVIVDVYAGRYCFPLQCTASSLSTVSRSRICFIGLQLEMIVL